MNVQVLVATMDQDDFSLVEKMNIQTDAIIGNQCYKNEVKDFIYNGKKIKYLSFNERGVGLNRNNALMRASADICILADDDMEFIEGYEGIVQKYFNENPTADVLIFNLIEKNPRRYVIKRKFKITNFNYMKFGAARIAFRRKSISLAGITFNLNFGGGATYSSGEDTIFLNDCLKKKLKIIAIPDRLAKMHEIRESSWFSGYNKKYFQDKGKLFFCISPSMNWLLSLQFVLRKRKKFANDMTWIEAFKYMRE